MGGGLPDSGIGDYELTLLIRRGGCVVSLPDVRDLELFLISSTGGGGGGGGWLHKHQPTVYGPSTDTVYSTDSTTVDRNQGWFLRWLGLRGGPLGPEFERPWEWLPTVLAKKVLPLYTGTHGDIFWVLAVGLGLGLGHDFNKKTINSII